MAGAPTHAGVGRRASKCLRLYDYSQLQGPRARNARARAAGGYVFRGEGSRGSEIGKGKGVAGAGPHSARGTAAAAHRVRYA